MAQQTGLNICIYFIFICSRPGTTSKCYNKESGTWYCCNNFEDTNGTCQGTWNCPCDVGYTSVDGRKCTPCPGGTYGERCTYRCKCQIFQRCDVRFGCLDLTTTIPYDVSSEQTTVTTESTTNCGLLCKGFTTGVQVTQTSAIYIETHGLFDKDIVIYSLCIGGLFIVITLCFILARLCWNISSNVKQNQFNRNNSHDSVNQSQSGMQTDTSSNQYDEIDENVNNIAIYLEPIHVGDDTVSNVDSNVTINNIEEGSKLSSSTPLVRSSYLPLADLACLERRPYSSLRNDQIVFTLSENSVLRDSKIEDDCHTVNNAKIYFEPIHAADDIITTDNTDDELRKVPTCPSVNN